MFRRILQIIVTCSAVHTVAGATFTVTNTLDSGPGSLRAAIIAANAQLNSPTTTPDEIRFAIPGEGVNTISPATALPSITDPVVIDGYSQPGARPNSLAVGDDAVLLIQLNGTGTTATGLVISAGNSTVRGLVISGFNDSPEGAGAIWLHTNGSNKIEGCFIGTDPTGTTEANNYGGILVSESISNTIGGTSAAARNLILGNTNPAINMQFASPSTASGLVIQGNYIGTDVSGTRTLHYSEVRLRASKNLFGGTEPGAGNVCAAWIIAEMDANSNTFQGNFIGVAADGKQALFSGSILLDTTSNNLVGGSTAAARNVVLAGIGDLARSTFLLGNNRIEGNYVGITADGTALLPQRSSDGGGVFLGGTHGDTVIRNVIAGFAVGVSIDADSVTGASGNVVTANLIGTNAGGNAALGNGTGVFIGGGYRPLDAQATDNVIGGPTSADRNVISGNAGYAVSVSARNNTVQNNFIGVGKDGVTPIPNGGGGISISGSIEQGDAGSGNQISGNVVAYNGFANIAFAAGVRVYEGSRNRIAGNSIFANFGDGIDLNGAAGPPPNDVGDPDSGPNEMQNCPVITSVRNHDNTTTIAGTLNSTPNTSYTIELFANGIAAQRRVGSTTVTTDANGDASFEVDVPPMIPGRWVTATATDPTGNTSEFSAAAGRLANISTRGQVLGGDDVLIGGFIVKGSDSKRVILRALGPSLATGGVADPLLDPTLELHDENGNAVMSNDDWQSDQAAEIEKTGISPADPKESAIIATLPGNGESYTAVLRGKDDSAGTALVEVYDLARAADASLANISTRGHVATDDDVLIAGFIVDGGGAETVVRALGPSLAGSGVAGTLQDPTVELRDRFGVAIAFNDNWRQSQETALKASGLAPKDPRESALLAQLPAGPYTAIVRGAGGATGAALVEVYQLQ